MGRQNGGPNRRGGHADRVRPAMLNVIFSSDYEIHGNGDGCPYELMVEPTDRMLRQFAEYGAKLTIMADIGEILKFKEHAEQTGRDDFHYEKIAAQLKETIRNGHDVQLHIHASYFNARLEHGSWKQDWSEYNFAGLPYERLQEVVRVGKEFLETLLQPVNPDYRCEVFRAANWSMSPSRNAVRALVENGIRIDTSVFKHGRRKGIVSFDYSNACSDVVPWRVDENDICRRSDSGKLLEVPIYSERRWIGAFLTANRIYRTYLTRKHTISNGNASSENPNAGTAKRGVLSKVSAAWRQHAWKADFNQCSGHQLIRALERAFRKHDCGPQRSLPFVLIGHSKLFTRWNERSLAPFLRHVRENPERFKFGRFDTQEETVRYSES